MITWRGQLWLSLTFCPVSRFQTVESGNKLLYHTHLPVQNQKSRCARREQSRWEGQPRASCYYIPIVGGPFGQTAALIKGNRKRELLLAHMEIICCLCSNTVSVRTQQMFVVMAGLETWCHSLFTVINRRMREREVVVVIRRRWCTKRTRLKLHLTLRWAAIVCVCMDVGVHVLCLLCLPTSCIHIPLTHRSLEQYLTCVKLAVEDEIRAQTSSITPQMSDCRKHRSIGEDLKLARSALWERLKEPLTGN